MAKATPISPEQEIDSSSLPGSKELGLLGVTGDAVVFTGRGIRGIAHVGPFAGEVLRQAAVLAVGSVLVIMAIAFLAGGSCGLESTFLARQFGFAPVAGGFSTWCTLREVVPFVFGYILAAKVGCGMVAEIGAMQANEEVDALETIGVRSIPYLVSTRMLAAAIVLPGAYILAVASAYTAAYLMSVIRFGDVSQGTWELFFFNFQDISDLIYSVVKGMVIAGFVVSTALFFGYRVRGGPVEVGVATARSMAVNIVGVTFISMLGTLIFWGANPRIPIG